jgi:thiol-disulfide isomerase/thioredoxin
MNGTHHDSIPPIAGIKCAGPETNQITLQIGDKAPEIQITRWLLGEPLEKIEHGHAYIIEFWASWCGPCAEAMPHISKLQAEHPDIIFLSVAVWEEQPEAPTDFVHRMRSLLNHRIAVDLPIPGTEDHSGLMADSWLKAAGESAVPTAFLVNEEGYIVWIGHPGELDEIIAQFKNKTLLVDLNTRKQKQALQRLELDPTVMLDPNIFSTLFNIKPPSIQTAKLEWLMPAEKQIPKTAEKTSGGLFSKFLGKPKEESKSQISRGLNVYGKPVSGRPLGILILPMLMENGVSPGWELLDLESLNTLPQEFDSFDFIALLRGASSLKELYGEEYEQEMAKWSAELGWRIALEILDLNSETVAVNAQNLSNFILGSFHCAEPPLALLLDKSGSICWVGSPIRLKEAVERLEKGELLHNWVLGELIFWYQLNASASANERMAGAHQQRIFDGLATEGPILDSDPAMIESWETTIAKLKQQLPWRAERWRIFEFRLAAARTRLTGHGKDATEKLIKQFRSITDTLAEQVEVSPVFMADWKMLLQIAMEQMGLLKDPLATLAAPDLLALEAHPFTSEIVESARLHDAAIPPAEEIFVFQPRMLPIIYFKLGRFSEALAEQEKMISDFDHFVAHQIRIMSEIDPDELVEPDMQPENLADNLIMMMLGESPKSYRANLIKLRDYYAKASSES